MSWKATALKCGRRAVARQPGASRAIAGQAAWLAWRLRGDARQRVIRNLLPLVGDDERRAKRASLAVFRGVAQYHVDLLSLPSLDLAAYNRDRLTIENAEYLQAILAPGSVIIVSAHMGNPEMAIQALTPRGRKFGALVERLEPRDFANEMLDLRRAGGGEFFESSLSGVKALMRHIESGGLAGFVGDRDIAGNGIPVTLCQRRVRISAIPWEIARRTGATVVPAFSLRQRQGKMLVTLGEPFRVERAGDRDTNLSHAAQRWATAFERQLMRAPGQWYVMEDFWKVHGIGDEQPTSELRENRR